MLGRWIVLVVKRGWARCIVSGRNKVVAILVVPNQLQQFFKVAFALVVVFGSLMYVVEGSDSGFTSIPKSVYWAIVTITTVGYGDIAPKTPLGQIIASTIMIMGYGIIAVPTGIYSAELIKSSKADKLYNHACPACGANDHDFDANFCKYCGHYLGKQSN